MIGGEQAFELPDQATVEEIFNLLPVGVSRDLLNSCAVAVNQQYASRQQALQEDDEVALLPPVSGGAPCRIALVREPIVPQEILCDFASGADGAVVTFEGIVRDNTRGRRTLHLDYEAYEEMALQQMQVLADTACRDHGVHQVVLVHRLGLLTVGEISVFLAVASAHRPQAFSACRWLIDTLKQTVPIWKKETFEDGAVWVAGEPFPEALVR